MKILLTYLITILSGFAAHSQGTDGEVVKGSRDSQNPMRIILNEDKTITGARGQTLVIDGFVDISHKDDLDDAQNVNGQPTKIMVVYDHIRFKDNSRITTKSWLVLTSLKTISGSVNVVNIRGVNGETGANGNSEANQAINGSGGKSSVKGANASAGSSASVGPNGEDGTGGARGIAGTDGQHGGNGSEGGFLTFYINAVDDNTTFKVSANGGDGGKGGDGGRGQDGGNGGSGGNGGAGGNSNIPCRSGANGGNGGKGGDGGDGGNGGSGGNGGNGGNGGTVQFFSANDATIRLFNSSPTAIDYQIEGGKKGFPGLGGAGGKGGKGASGGLAGAGGEGGGHVPFCSGDGSPGSQGVKGRDGSDGFAGNNGRFGQNGLKGRFNIPDIRIATPEVVAANSLWPDNRALGSTPTGRSTTSH